MILLLPTLMVGIWEIVRHELLIKYISMDAGNYLTPIFLFVLSIMLLLPLFAIMERSQRELEQERALKHAMEARDKLAQELHDGMAQSLFLLSVKIDRLENSYRSGEVSEDNIRQIRKTVHEVDRYVRQAIANLKIPVSEKRPFSLEQSVKGQLMQIAGEVMIEVSLDWSLPDAAFTAKEKAELLSCIREALINVRKHTRAANVAITGQGDGRQWIVTVIDNGEGFQHPPFEAEGSYGLQIMKERAEGMGWKLQVSSGEGGTMVKITKGVDLA